MTVPDFQLRDVMYAYSWFMYPRPLCMYDMHGMVLLVIMCCNHPVIRSCDVIVSIILYVRFVILNQSSTGPIH